MRLFTDKKAGTESRDQKKSFYLNSDCPFNEYTLCGTWCALCHVHKDEDGTPRYVILGCKGTDKQLFVEGVVD